MQWRGFSTQRHWRAGALLWLACAVLALVVLWLLARLGLQVIRPVGTASPPAAPTAKAGAPGTPATRPIASWHLFGTASADRASSASGGAATTLSLILRGTVAEADPGAGIAVVAEPGQGERAVRVGEDVAPGTRLVAVHPDRAVFSQNGSEQTVYLPREPLPAREGIVQPTPGTPGDTSGATGYRPPLGGAAAAPVRASSSPGQGTLRNEVARARQNPGELLQRFRIEPVFAGGALGGVRVNAANAADGALLQQAGLQPGDVVTRIDGQAIDTLSAGQQALARLGNASAVRVTVERQGRPVELTISLH